MVAVTRSLDLLLRYFCVKESPPIHSKSGYLYRVSSCYVGEELTFVLGAFISADLLGS